MSVIREYYQMFLYFQGCAECVMSKKTSEVVYLKQMTSGEKSVTGTYQASSNFRFLCVDFT